MVKAQKWVKCKEFEGQPTKENFRLEEEELPALQDGEVLFEATYLSVDPYMRVFPCEVGSTLIGQSIFKVAETKNPDYPVGSDWLLQVGWRSHVVLNPTNQKKNGPHAVKPLKVGDLPHSLGLGTLGMPGATAYLGLIDFGQPKPGDTVLVNGAAGAVGNVVGQVAKIKGCTVIGYAGTEEKVKWLKEELGFDFAFNYKKVDLSESIKQAAPEGADVYFDNVGGDFTNTVMLNHMKLGGRVVIVGGISVYNRLERQKGEPGVSAYGKQEPPKGPLPYMTIMFNCLSVRGFIVGRDCPMPRWDDAFAEMAQWIKEGKLKYREHITKGFDNMPEAFMELFTGANTGKAIVKV